MRFQHIALKKKKAESLFVHADSSCIINESFGWQTYKSDYTITYYLLEHCSYMHDINLDAYKPETSGENREKESEKLLDVIARTFQFPQWQLKASVRQKAA